MDCIFVGAGAVAEKYAATLDSSPLSLAAVCDLERTRATRLAGERDAEAYTDLDAALADESAPLVVNLTSHAAHEAVTRRCLAADRHVFSEKPLALDADAAIDLVRTAESRNLALGCAPNNHRCDAQRHARELLADGRFGRIRVGYAHAHVGRVTDWHDRPDSFLEVGPLYDGAVYPLNLLVSWFGPVREVRTADAVDAWPERETRTPDRPAHVEASLEFERGAVVRLLASFYVPHRSREFYGLELHGDDGSLYLDDTGALESDVASVSVAGGGREYVAAPVPRPSRRGDHLDGPAQLGAAIARDQRPTRDARRGAHVVAICNAIEVAARDGGSQTVPAFGVETPALGAPPVRPSRDVHATAASEAAIRLPPVGFGCSRYRDGEYRDRIDAIATALDAGYRLLDSAELYGNETRIGRLLDSPGTPDRESLFLVSKVWNTNHGHVEEACRGSLDELGVDALDCYMLHWPDAWAYRGPLRNLADLPPDEQEALTFPEDDHGERATADVSLTDAWRRLEAVHEMGLARTLGACNLDVAQLHEILDAARVPPAVVQVERHPYQPRTRLVEACHARGIRVMAHSPLSAPGLLDEPVLEEIAAKHGASPASVVLAWNVERGVVPIPSSDDRDHVVENLAAARTRLDDVDRDRIAALEDPTFER